MNMNDNRPNRDFGRPFSNKKAEALEELRAQQQIMADTARNLAQQNSFCV